MKVIFVTYDLPFPLDSGGKIRAYYLIKYLSKNHDITLFSFYRSELQKKYVKELKKYCRKVFLFKRRKPWSLKNIFHCLYNFIPFASATYYSDDFKRKLTREVAIENYDLVHFESYYTALYLPEIKKLGIKTLMGNENVEYQVYDRYASKQPGVIRALLKLEVMRMRNFEYRLWRQADYNIAISQNDALAVERITGRKCPIIPNGVDMSVYKNIKPKGNGSTIVFVGTLIYQGNSDAVQYFLKDIYPTIKLNFPQVKFLLVSWHKPKWLAEYLNDSSIEYIADRETHVREFYAKSDILVVPVRVAGGTRIKILEAMAIGLPVITTKIGVEGICATSGREVIVADDSNDFAKKAIILLSDKNVRRALSAAGKTLVGKNYNWKGIVENLDKMYKSVADEI